MDLNEDDVLQIIRYLDESGFNELRLQIGDLRIVVNRSGNALPLPEVDQPATSLDPPAATPPLGTPPASAERPPPPPAADAPPTQPTADDRAGRASIVSPMLGTFYRAPEPGAPPFVEVGSLVEEDTTVCIIEVMKLFSTIKAERRGRITRISVNDGELVEYGQVLFLVDSGAA